MARSTPSRTVRRPRFSTPGEWRTNVAFGAPPGRDAVYINAALEQLRAAGHPVLDEDVRRLHPFMRRHLAVQGDYSFLLPALAGRLRELRDPTEAPDEDEEED